MNNMTKEHELKISIYQDDGNISTAGYNKNNKGLIYFVTDYNMYGLSGESKIIAKVIKS